MTNFSLAKIFVRVFEDLFSYLEIKHKFMLEVAESSLNSTDEVNTLVGVSGDIEGNILFGYNNETEREIAAKLMGKTKDDIKNIDLFVKAALTDFFSDFAKRSINLIRIENFFYKDDSLKSYTILSSNPTYISGNELYGIIGQVASKKVFFKVNGEKFNIAYSLRQK